MITTIHNPLPQEPLSLQDMPNEILKCILDAIYDPDKVDRDNLMALGRGFVSRKLSERVVEVKNDWVNQKGMSLKLFGCNTADEAVQYIIKHRLTSANLSAFADFNIYHLIELSQNALQIKMLWLGALNRDASKVRIRPCMMSSGDFAKHLVESLARFTCLRVITIDSCSRVNDEVVQGIAQLPGVEHLSLKKCEWLNVIQLSPTLRSLDLSGTRIYGGELDEALEELRSPCLIEILDLSECKSLESEWLEAIIAKLPNLRSLNLSGNKHLFGENLAKALSKCPKLEILDLSGCQQMTGTELVDLPLLYSLNLSCCFSLKEIAGSYPLLRNLSICHCREIPADQLTQFTKLECLNMTGCSRISCDDLNKIVNSLTSLNLSYCDHITDEQLKQVALAFPMLKHLARQMYGGVRTNSDALVESLRSFTSLQNFNYSIDLREHGFSFSIGRAPIPMLYISRACYHPDTFATGQPTDFSVDQKKQLLF